MTHIIYLNTFTSIPNFQEGCSWIDAMIAMIMYYGWGFYNSLESPILVLQTLPSISSMAKIGHQVTLRPLSPASGEVIVPLETAFNNVGNQSINQSIPSYVIKASKNSGH